MNSHTQFASEARLGSVGDKLQSIDWERVGVFYARFALGAAFLSAVAARFGLWQGTFDPKHFAKFLEYAGEGLSFMPRASIPYLAWAATVCETSLGILLILGLWQRWVSLASALLLVMFGTAMAISFGLQSPMDYSVYSASGAAIMLALHAFTRNTKSISK
ncbi:MAG: MauE/DoxX family redox-associated membrane protein [Terriglobales bacterium]